jgi:hypothetical protein
VFVWAVVVFVVAVGVVVVMLDAMVVMLEVFIVTFDVLNVMFEDEKLIVEHAVANDPPVKEVSSDCTVKEAGYMVTVGCRVVVPMFVFALMVAVGNAGFNSGFMEKLY